MLKFIEKLNWFNFIDLGLLLLLLGFLLIVLIKKGSVKLGIFYSLCLICAVAFKIAAIALNLILVDTLINYVVIGLITSLVVVYRSDIRIFFQKLSKPKEDQAGNTANTDEELRQATSEIVKAAQNMSKIRTGALILIVPGSISSYILDTGTSLGALVTSQLLESIFNTKAPLHDGAVVVKGNKILSAGCFLPLTQATNLPKDWGTRHRAAIGITEETDVMAIVVSEETGIISVATAGSLKRYVTTERLADMLYSIYKIATPYKKKRLS